MIGIDGKYHIVGDKIVNSFNGNIIPEDEPLFLLRGRDRLALATLHEYQQLCIEDDCTKFHLDGVDQIIKAFQRFRYNFPERMKQPGCTEGK